MHDIPRLKMYRRERILKEESFGGVCVSEDGGRTWQVSNTGLPDKPMTHMVLDPKSPKKSRTLYVAVQGQGVFKSMDGGKSWTKKNNGFGENLYAWELTLMDDNTLFVVMNRGPRYKDGKTLREPMNGEIYMSKDGAETWTKVILPDKVNGPNTITLDPHNSDRIYVSCWSSIMTGDLMGRANALRTGTNDIIETQGGVLVSDDKAKTWKQIFNPDIHVYHLLVHPKKPGHLLITTNNGILFRTGDHGKSWRKVKGFYFRLIHRAFSDPHNPDMVYVTTFGGGLYYGPAFEL
jgi:photosystem II stability/assembly factor-like uncharacterized protein